MSLPDDVDGIEERCEELAEEGSPPRLVVIDPLAAFIGASVDTHRDASVRGVLAPLAKFAERQQLAVLAVTHLNKDTTSKLLNRVGGSVAFGAAPRSGLAFARHPDDPEGDRGSERVIVHFKHNHGRYAPTLAARIEVREVDVVGEVSRLVITGECDLSADDLSAQPGGDRHEREDAAEWLMDELADGQWHPSRELKERAERAGHSKRTLHRARADLGVEDRREGYPAVSEWRLPVVPPPTPERGTTEGGTRAQTCILEPNVGVPPPSRANTPSRGTTEEFRLASEEEEAEAERLRRKFAL